ncbi:MAG: molybdopterin-dependent oxidoreductase [Eubacteriales bacterium]|nr:molybdopterin-dependent oxidoreductase [Eubacteriales bacterium]
MRVVGQPIRKKDAMALVTGKPVYMDDVVSKDSLIIKLIRSPHANALVKKVDASRALKIPGIEAVFTWEDVPGNRFTIAGQTYPEPSAYDRLILDQHVRFVGDAVAMVVGADEQCVDRAMKLVKVEYEVLPAVLDFHEAMDNEILVHPEDDWEAKCPVGADNKRNLVAHAEEEHGEIDRVMSECEVIVEETYHTKANQQAMMETFRSSAYLDEYGRLVILSSTQIVYHVRRIISTALGIPKSKIRVKKPRIGGGFGAKQTAVCEMYPAFVTWKTGKPSKIVYSRVESQIASSPRHEMEMTVKIGAMKDGRIRAIDMYTLSNSGAYSEHGPTTVGLSGHKSIPLYNQAEAHRFVYDVVYTNVLSAGAYRGYGATQGLFAVESAVNQLAAKLNMDPVEIRRMNMLREGEIMPAYYGEPNNSCTLDRCLDRAAELMNWNEKYPCTDMGNGKVRSVGVGMAMQGSCISNIDVGSASLRLNEDGYYTLKISAADMGTGCDTILAQMAAEVLECEIDDVVVYGADTDSTPYDSGSYASSTTYITGKAVEKAGYALREKIIKMAAQMMGESKEQLEFTGQGVNNLKTGEILSLTDIGTASMCGNTMALEVTESNTSPISPPPYMAGMVEIELDKETGHVEILDYVAVVDCGTVVNPNLARVQLEGGLAQGIGMTLYEDISYSERGQLLQNSLMQYKIPTRMDIGNIRSEFCPSYEKTGPFGAKSIGELVINTPLPALTHAIYNATGLWFRELPITSEKIAMGLLEKEQCE